MIENSISGLIITLAIAIADYRLGIIALASSIIGTWVASVGGADKTLIKQGLFGFNSVLTGLALFLFLNGNQRWVIALAGAAIASLFTAAMMSAFSKSGTPVLTFPFIVLTWFLLLTSYHLRFFELTPKFIPQDLSTWTLSTKGTIDIISGLIEGIGQVYFQQPLLSGLLVLVGILWSNWKLGLYAIIGTAVAWLTAYILHPEPSLLNNGIYGYNAVLTILAVAKVFDAQRRLAPFTGIIAAIITVPITASIAAWLSPYGLPVLTMPFVLVTWLFIGARRVLVRI